MQRSQPLHASTSMTTVPRVRTVVIGRSPSRCRSTTSRGHVVDGRGLEPAAQGGLVEVAVLLAVRRERLVDGGVDGGAGRAGR